MCLRIQKIVILDKSQTTQAMKKIILICCTLFLFSNVWFAAMLDGKAKETTVFIALIKIYKGPRPRSMEFVPSCEYVGTVGSLKIDFGYNPGQYTVLVVNGMTGEQWFEMGDTDKMEMDISGDPGNYSIDIETESGDTFTGNFTLQ